MTKKNAIYLLCLLMSSFVAASTPIRSSSDVAVVYEQIVATIEQQYTEELIAASDSYRDGLIGIQLALSIISHRSISDSIARKASPRITTHDEAVSELNLLQQRFMRMVQEALSRRSERRVKATNSLVQLVRKAEANLRKLGHIEEADAMRLEAKRLDDIVKQENTVSTKSAIVTK